MHTDQEMENKKETKRKQIELPSKHGALRRFRFLSFTRTAISSTEKFFKTEEKSFAFEAVVLGLHGSYMLFIACSVCLSVCVCACVSFGSLFLACICAHESLGTCVLRHTDLRRLFRKGAMFLGDDRRLSKMHCLKSFGCVKRQTEYHAKNRRQLLLVIAIPENV